MEHRQTHTPDENRSVLRDLFAPVNEDKVLIQGETTIYDERLHWASLLQPLIETVAVLLLVTALSGGRNADGPVLAILGVCAFGLVAYRVNAGDWSKRATFAVVGLLILGVIQFGEFGVAFIAIVVAVLRFWFKVLFWLSYEKLYITNRRIIIAKAFLGSEINTMPLTRVTDISYKTTITADLLRYGILRVETAGQDQALSFIRFVEKPEEFYDTLIARTTAAVGSVTDPLDEDDGSGTLEA
jgi:hypothetical protein